MGGCRSHEECEGYKERCIRATMRSTDVGHIKVGCEGHNEIGTIRVTTSKVGIRVCACVLLAIALMPHVLA